MSDNFYDNQHVTATGINNIVNDLTDEEYSEFSDGEQYNIDFLNRITADLVSPGVLMSGNKCAVTKENEELFIDTGIIVLPNGMKKRIECKKKIQGSILNGYVYAAFSEAENIVNVTVSEELPQDAEIVSLAKISEGKVEDMRSICSSNAITKCKTPHFSVEFKQFSIPKDDNYQTPLYEFDNGVEYDIVYFEHDPDYGDSHSYVKLIDGELTEYKERIKPDSDCTASVRLKKTGTKITIYGDNWGRNYFNMTLNFA